MSDNAMQRPEYSPDDLAASLPKMPHTLTVGELKEQLTMLDDSREVYICVAHDEFVPARRGYATNHLDRNRLVFVVSSIRW